MDHRITMFCKSTNADSGTLCNCRMVLCVFCEVCYAGFVVTILKTHDFKLAPTHTVETEREPRWLGEFGSEWSEGVTRRRQKGSPREKWAVMLGSANKDTHTSTHPDREEGVNAAKVHVSSCLPLCMCACRPVARPRAERQRQPSSLTTASWRVTPHTLSCRWLEAENQRRERSHSKLPRNDKTQNSPSLNKHSYII